MLMTYYKKKKNKNWNIISQDFIYTDYTFKRYYWVK